jgi:hypothetical protein
MNYKLSMEIKDIETEIPRVPLNLFPTKRSTVNVVSASIQF